MLASFLRYSSTQCVSRTRQCTMELYDQLDTREATFAYSPHNDIAGDEPQSFSMFQRLAVSCVYSAQLVDSALTTDDLMFAACNLQHDVKFEADL